MAPSSTQVAWRGRIERVLRLAEPALDLVLLGGDRLSRAVDRQPDVYVPARRIERPGGRAAPAADRDAEPDA